MKSEWHNQTCPVCFEGKLKDGVRQEHVAYQGAVYEWMQKGAFCDRCGDGIVQGDEDDDARFIAFRDAVDAHIADEMQAICQRRGLSRQDLMLLLGGGKNAFKRYIDRETRPTAAVWNLMRAIDLHPELAEELKRPAAAPGLHAPAGGRKRAA